MNWTRAYWDAVDEIYWEPSLIGLVSVGKQRMVRKGDTIQISASTLPPGGSIYTRPGRAAANAHRLRGLEVPLNHLVDLTFAIAADGVINEILLAPFGLSDHGPFERLGRDIAYRYPGFEDNTATQQDGFYVSPISLVGVEMKLAAKTDPAQVLKYATLMVAEEMRSGVRDQVCLLFITPEQDSARVFKQAGASPEGHLSGDYLQRAMVSVKSARLARMVDGEPKAFQNLISRLKLAHLTWVQLARALDMQSERQKNDAGGETLSRLLGGLAEAIRRHGGTAPPQG